MTSKIATTLQGSAGIVAIEFTPAIVNAVPVGAGDLVQALTQIVVAVVTIIGLLRKDKKK